MEEEMGITTNTTGTITVIRHLLINYFEWETFINPLNNKEHQDNGTNKTP